jgi:hypothetical protein
MLDVDELRDVADNFGVSLFSEAVGLLKLIALFKVDVERDVSSIDILTLEFN